MCQLLALVNIGTREIIMARLSISGAYRIFHGSIFKRAYSHIARGRYSGGKYLERHGLLKPVLRRSAAREAAVTRPTRRM